MDGCNVIHWKAIHRYCFVGVVQRMLPSVVYKPLPASANDALFTGIQWNRRHDFRWIQFYKFVNSIAWVDCWGSICLHWNGASSHPSVTCNLECICDSRREDHDEYHWEEISDAEHVWSSLKSVTLLARQNVENSFHNWLYSSFRCSDGWHTATYHWCCVCKYMRWVSHTILTSTHITRITVGGITAKFVHGFTFIFCCPSCFLLSGNLRK